MELFHPESQKNVDYLKLNLIRASFKYHFNATGFINMVPETPTSDYVLSLQSIEAVSNITDTLFDVQIIVVPKDIPGKMILQLVLESGVATTSVQTKLRMTSFEGIDTFCGSSTTECSPDNATATTMMEYIIKQSSSILITQNPDYQFNGWQHGSVICDYEISFVTPLREIKVSDGASSAMDLYLANVGDAFSEVGLDENFTLGATSEQNEISCDSNHFVCDYSSFLKNNIRLGRTGACLPRRWLCDGYIQCPTIIDELDCDMAGRSTERPEVSFMDEFELFVDEVYISHKTFPKHYRNNQHTVQTFTTSSEMVFVLHFEHFHLEVDRVTGQCGDFIELKYQVINQTFISQYCGNIATGEEPFIPPRRLVIPSAEFQLTFTSDSFTHFDGYLIRVESIPKTIYFGFAFNYLNFTLFNESLYYQCYVSDSGVPVIIPLRWRCDRIIDCPLGSTTMTLYRLPRAREII